MNARDTAGVVYKNGSVTMMRRVTGNDAANIVQADISSGVYTAYLLADNAPDTQTAVTNHTAIAIVVADTIFDTLQTTALDAAWTEDTTGYNFRHILDVSANQAFTIAGRTYRVIFTLTPASGQVIEVRFRLAVI